MKRMSCLLALLLVGAAERSRAEEPRAVLERAIKAMGGDVDPARTPARRGRGTCRVNVGKGVGEQLPVTVDLRYQSPRTFRCDLGLDFPRKGSTIVMAFDNGRGWSQQDGQVLDLSPNDQRDLGLAEPFLNPMGLPALLADKTVVLSSLEDGRADGRVVKRVKAVFENKATLEISFDKDSGLPVEKVLTVPDQGTLKVILSDYREVGLAADERVVKAAGIASAGPALATYLRGCLPDPAKATRVAALVKQLGDESFDVREQAPPIFWRWVRSPYRTWNER